MLVAQHYIGRDVVVAVVGMGTKSTMKGGRGRVG